MLKSFLLCDRPYAVFDAANPEHRAAYAEFLKKRTWEGCPYKFVLEEPYIDLPANINHRLVEYYLGKEFADKKTKKKIVVK